MRKWFKKHIKQAKLIKKAGPWDTDWKYDIGNTSDPKLSVASRTEIITQRIKDFYFLSTVRPEDLQKSLFYGHGFEQPQEDIDDLSEISQQELEREQQQKSGWEALVANLSQAKEQLADTMCKEYLEDLRFSISAELRHLMGGLWSETHKNKIVTSNFNPVTMARDWAERLRAIENPSAIPDQENTSFLINKVKNLKATVQHLESTSANSSVVSALKSTIYQLEKKINSQNVDADQSPKATAIRSFAAQMEAQFLEDNGDEDDDVDVNVWQFKKKNWTPSDVVDYKKSQIGIMSKFLHESTAAEWDEIVNKVSNFKKELETKEFAKEFSPTDWRTTRYTYKNGIHIFKNLTSDNYSPGSNSYLDYYQTYLKAYKCGFTNRELALFATLGFLQPKWMSSYGGPSWAVIAKALALLDELDKGTHPFVAKLGKTEAKGFGIDLAHNLQHNTGAAFTKPKAVWSFDGDSKWLQHLLDWKASAETTFIDRFKAASQQIQEIGWLYLYHTQNAPPQQMMNKVNAYSKYFRELKQKGHLCNFLSSLHPNGELNDLRFVVYARPIDWICLAQNQNFSNEDRNLFLWAYTKEAWLMDRPDLDYEVYKAFYRSQKLSPQEFKSLLFNLGVDVDEIFSAVTSPELETPQTDQVGFEDTDYQEEQEDINAPENITKEEQSHNLIKTASDENDDPLVFQMAAAVTNGGDEYVQEIKHAQLEGLAANPHLFNSDPEAYDKVFELCVKLHVYAALDNFLKNPIFVDSSNLTGEQKEKIKNLKTKISQVKLPANLVKEKEKASFYSIFSDQPWPDDSEIETSVLSEFVGDLIYKLDAAKLESNQEVIPYKSKSGDDLISFVVTVDFKNNQAKISAKQTSELVQLSLPRFMSGNAYFKLNDSETADRIIKTIHLVDSGDIKPTIKAPISQKEEDLTEQKAFKGPDPSVSTGVKPGESGGSTAMQNMSSILMNKFGMFLHKIDPNHNFKIHSKTNLALIGEVSTFDLFMVVTSGLQPIGRATLTKRKDTHKVKLTIKIDIPDVFEHDDADTSFVTHYNKEDKDSSSYNPDADEVFSVFIDDIIEEMEKEFKFQQAYKQKESEISSTKEKPYIDSSVPSLLKDHKIGSNEIFQEILTVLEEACGISTEYAKESVNYQEINYFVAIIKSPHDSLNGKFLRLSLDFNGKEPAVDISISHDFSQWQKFYTEWLSLGLSKVLVQIVGKINEQFSEVPSSIADMIKYYDHFKDHNKSKLNISIVKQSTNRYIIVLRSKQFYDKFFEIVYIFGPESVAITVYNQNNTLVSATYYRYPNISYDYVLNQYAAKLLDNNLWHSSIFMDQLYPEIVKKLKDLGISSYYVSTPNSGNITTSFFTDDKHLLFKFVSIDQNISFIKFEDGTSSNSLHLHDWNSLQEYIGYIALFLKNNKDKILPQLSQKEPSQKNVSSLASKIKDDLDGFGTKLYDELEDIIPGFSWAADYASATMKTYVHHTEALATIQINDDSTIELIGSKSAPAKLKFNENEIDSFINIFVKYIDPILKDKDIDLPLAHPSPIVSNQITKIIKSSLSQMGKVTLIIGKNNAAFFLNYDTVPVVYYDIYATSINVLVLKDQQKLDYKVELCPLNGVEKLANLLAEIPKTYNSSPEKIHTFDKSGKYVELTHPTLEVIATWLSIRLNAATRKEIIHKPISNSEYEIALEGKNGTIEVAFKLKDFDKNVKVYFVKNPSMIAWTIAKSDIVSAYRSIELMISDLQNDIHQFFGTVQILADKNAKSLQNIVRGKLAHLLQTPVGILEATESPQQVTCYFIREETGNKIGVLSFYQASCYLFLYNEAKDHTFYYIDYSDSLIELYTKGMKPIIESAFIQKPKPKPEVNGWPVVDYLKDNLAVYFELKNIKVDYGTSETDHKGNYTFVLLLDGNGYLKCNYNHNASEMSFTFAPKNGVGESYSAQGPKEKILQETKYMLDLQLNQKQQATEKGKVDKTALSKIQLEIGKYLSKTVGAVTSSQAQVDEHGYSFEFKLSTNKKLIAFIKLAQEGTNIKLSGGLYPSESVLMKNIETQSNNVDSIIEYVKAEIDANWKITNKIMGFTVANSDPWILYLNLMLQLENDILPNTDYEVSRQTLVQQGIYQLILSKDNVPIFYITSVRYANQKPGQAPLGKTTVVNVEGIPKLTTILQTKEQVASVGVQIANIIINQS